MLVVAVCFPGVFTAFRVLWVFCLSGMADPALKALQSVSCLGLHFVMMSLAER